MTDVTFLASSPKAASPPRWLAAGDSFVGRGDTITKVEAWLKAGERLIAVSGLGGSGKTRLVREVARSLWERNTGWSLFLCDMRPVSNASEALAAIARSVGAQGPDENLLDASVRVLRSHQRALLVLDAYGTLTAPQDPDIAQLIESITSAAPDTRIIMTSRIIPRIPGIQAVRLGALSAEEAQQLFVQRALRAGADPARLAAEQSQIDALVDQLDALPLAIEMAASHAGLLGPSQLLSQMKHRFRLLRERVDTGSQGRTLKAVIAWSWERLTAWEQHVVMALAVFEQSFDLSAAEAVIEPDEVPDAPWLVDTFHVLLEYTLLCVDHSLEPKPGTDLPMRYQLLRSVRDFAVQQQKDRPDSVGRETLSARHAQYFGGWAERQNHALDGPELRQVLVYVEADRANVEQVIDWCRSTPQPTPEALAEATWCAITLLRYQRYRGSVSESVQRVAALVATPGADQIEPALKVRLLLERASNAAYCANFKRADRYLSSARGLALSYKLLDLLCRAYAISGYVASCQHQQVEANVDLEEAVRLADVLNDMSLQAESRWQLGVHLCRSPEFEAGLAHQDAALQFAEHSRSVGMALRIAGSVGLWNARLGRFKLARKVCRRAIVRAAELGERTQRAIMLNNLGFVELCARNPGGALEAFAKSEGLIEGQGLSLIATIIAGNRAVAYHMGGELKRAASAYETVPYMEKGDRFLWENLKAIMLATEGAESEARARMDGLHAHATDGELREGAATVFHLLREVEHIGHQSSQTNADPSRAALDLTRLTEIETAAREVSDPRHDEVLLMVALLLARAQAIREQLR